MLTKDLVWLSAILLTVFIVDLFVPLGIAVGVLYVLATAYAVWKGSMKNLVLVAFICSGLILAGYLASSGTADSWTVILNRAVSIVAVWIVVLVAAITGRRLPLNLSTDTPTMDDFFVDQGEEQFQVAPVSIDEFVANLGKSRVLHNHHLDEAVAVSCQLDPGTAARKLVDSGVLTKFQANRIFHGYTAGLVYGDYIVQERIGKGGSGVVYRAVHRETGEQVAIKTLQADNLNQKAVYRFEREILASVSLEHPNLTNAVLSGRDGNVLYLVMELVTGKNLFDWVCFEHRLPWRAAVDAVIQAANGLQYAHDNGMVHRDLKPSNLILSDDGVLKILDLGLVRVLKNKQRPFQKPERPLTAVGSLAGSIDYMAPEQAASFHSADHRSDIFSLGCTLYFLLSGKTLLDGATMEEKVRTLLAKKEVFDGKLPSAPRRLATIVGKMLRADPNRRYQSMSHVADDLSQLDG